MPRQMRMNIMREAMTALIPDNNFRLTLTLPEGR